jgi:hypothetical protein
VSLAVGVRVLVEWRHLGYPEGGELWAFSIITLVRKADDGEQGLGLVEG